MKKFKFLVGFGLKKRLFKKAFIITNILIGIVIMGLINLPGIISLFSDDTTELETVNVAIINDTDDTTYPLETNIITVLNSSYMGFEYDYELTTTDLEDYDAFWDQSDIDVLLVFTGDLNQPNVEIYTQSQTQRDFLIGQIQTVLYEYQNITYANYDLKTPPPSDDDPALADEDRMFIQGIVSVLFLPVFILVIMATQFLGVDIIEEKSTKAIETIIASVPSKTHFLSKITASISFLLIQSGILLVFGIIGGLIGRLFVDNSNAEALSLLTELGNRISNWPSLLTFTLLFMIFGTLLFLILAALLAAVSTTQEDYQQFQAPLIFLLLGGYYIGIFLPMMGVDSVVRIFAYIPFFSTLVAPIAFATGVIGIFESIIILVVNIVAVILFLYIVAPIYRVAILSYEETKFFKRIKLYIKKAFSGNK